MLVNRPEMRHHLRIGRFAMDGLIERAGHHDIAHKIEVAIRAAVASERSISGNALEPEWEVAGLQSFVPPPDYDSQWQRRTRIVCRARVLHSLYRRLGEGSGN